MLISLISSVGGKKQHRGVEPDSTVSVCDSVQTDGIGLDAEDVSSTYALCAGSRRPYPMDPQPLHPGQGIQHADGKDAPLLGLP